MARIFTEQWLAERERKRALQNDRPTQAQKNEMAHTWNSGVANCEPIELCREGGAVSQPAHARPLTRVRASSAAPLYPLVGLCRGAGLPEPVPEFRFHPSRGWKFDYAFPLHMLAVEVEGGIWKKGGGAHSHPSNIVRDIEKYNEATILRWRILRVVPEKLTEALGLIARALAPTRDAA